MLNHVHEVDDSDNIKQDMSIDVYGRDKDEKVRASPGARRACACAAQLCVGADERVPHVIARSCRVTQATKPDASVEELYNA